MYLLNVINQRQVFSNLNFEIKKGEVGIVGNSGVGKSTF